MRHAKQEESMTYISGVKKQATETACGKKNCLENEHISDLTKTSK